MKKLLLVAMGVMVLVGCSKPDVTESENVSSVPQTYTSTSEQMTTDLNTDIDLEVLNSSGASSEGSL